MKLVYRFWMIRQSNSSLVLGNLVISTALVAI
jgi:hypothetical protein